MSFAAQELRAKHSQRYLINTFHQTMRMLDGLDPDSREYERLLQELEPIWHAIDQRWRP